MSKLPQRISKKAAPKPTGAALAEVMQERVRSYHRWGKMNMGVRDLTKKHRLSTSAAYKANQFAKSYTVRELKDFLKLRRESGRPLHWGHIQYLLIVPLDKKAIREELQAKAAEQDWTPKELLAEIRRRIPGERGPGGRPRKHGLVQSLIGQVNDAAAALKRLADDPGAADKPPLPILEKQFQDLDKAVLDLKAQIPMARRAVAAAARRRLV